MEKDVLNIDEVVPSIIEYSNIIHRNILDRLMKKSKNQDNIPFNIDDKKNILEMARSARKNIISEMKQYFLNNQELTLEVKKEVMKQTIMDFFEQEDFLDHINTYSAWGEKSYEIEKKIMDKYKTTIKRSDGFLEDLGALFLIDTKHSKTKKEYYKEIYSLKVDIEENEYHDFAKNISMEIRKRAVSDFQDIYSGKLNLDMGEDENINEIKINSSQIKTSRENIVNNDEIKKQSFKIK